MRRFFPITLTVILLLNTYFLFAARRAADEVPVKIVSENPPYREYIELLRANDSVIPPETTRHPIHSVYNREAVVPPQCYTQTEGHYNPCYVCHQKEIPGRENRMNDQELQADYSFSDLGTHNHWKNLFEDRSERVEQISDNAILAYVGQDNYSELSERLVAANFQGWIPDLANLHLSREAFDENGFAKDGSYWVAYNYKPLPSTFWPTNGSTDDVMIRLPEAFRTDKTGTVSMDIYRANLAILEARIKGVTSIDCLPVDETVVGIDLDENGTIEIANRIQKAERFVGAASELFSDSSLYPQGTEFLHTVRYVGIDGNGAATISTRMKEVRYMRKWKEYSKQSYARTYQVEAFDKAAGNLPGYNYLGQWGFDNGTGWSVQGFIEDSKGRLRANTYEENFFCMGCHNSIGSTIDKTFSFARKVDGAAGWSYINLRGMPDAPNANETEGEILTYLERVGGGSEFRNNTEMSERWFNADGSINRAKVEAAQDVYELIMPSRDRALTLNKAYKSIVEDQDFIFGRDATVTPPANVYDDIDNQSTPTLPDDRTFSWDIRLDWSAVQKQVTQAQ